MARKLAAILFDVGPQEQLDLAGSPNVSADSALLLAVVTVRIVLV